MNIERACTRWKEYVAPDRVLDEVSALSLYGENTNASLRRIRAAVQPVSVEEIQHILRIATEEHVALYPISTGHNWGYGTALPVSEDMVTLDLSRMNRILSFDDRLGIVTVEPGVTQQILYEYLESNTYEYLVPLTGAGPKGSILANALERGFGVTPVSDHFSAVTKLTAVLADGSIYNGPLDEYGGKHIDMLYRYSVGPYMDGMFSQSNIGIVTSMSIALAPKPEQTSVMMCSVFTEEELGRVVALLPKLLHTLGSVTGGFKFINRYQLQMMNRGKGVGVASFESFPLWTITVGLFGDRHMVNAAKKIIKRELKDTVHQLFFVDAQFFQKYSHVLLRLPLPSSLKGLIKNFHATLDLFLGKPNSVALAIAYAQSGTRPDNMQDADPGKDGCGIIWYAPLMPMDELIVVSYVRFVEKILKKYDIPPMISFTSVNDRCFDAPIAITFDKQNPISVANARQCYDELWNESKKLQLIPYRLPVDEQWRLTESGTPFWDIMEKIKNALDPNNIIAPKRYSKR